MPRRPRRPACAPPAYKSMRRAPCARDKGACDRRRQPKRADFFISGNLKAEMQVLRLRYAPLRMTVSGEPTKHGEVSRSFSSTGVGCAFEVLIATSGRPSRRPAPWRRYAHQERAGQAGTGGDAMASRSARVMRPWARASRTTGTNGAQMLAAGQLRPPPVSARAWAILRGHDR